MKEITKYQTEDGSVFDSEKEAHAHEGYCELAKYLESEFPVYIGPRDWVSIARWLATDAFARIDYAHPSR